MYNIKFSVMVNSLIYKIYSLMSMDFAWEYKPSSFANVETSSLRLLKFSFEKEIILLLLQKSYTPRGEKNFAVPPVGST